MPTGSHTMEQQQTPSNTALLHAAPPAQLWVGPDEELVRKTYQHLQQAFCHDNGCGSCTTCTQIAEDRHHAIRWFCPEKYYTADTIANLFDTISFALEPSQQFFFVLKRADFLTASCANMLLKPIEEPPPGYRFILLAQRLQPVLPTIRSRCTVTIDQSAADTATDHALFAACATTRLVDPSDFLRTLDQSKINERETIELLDKLLAHWNRHYTTSCANGNKEHQEILQRVIAILETALEKPPMPGSSKIFWKNLFLQIKASRPKEQP